MHQNIKWVLCSESFELSGNSNTRYSISLLFSSLRRAPLPALHQWQVTKTSNWLDSYFPPFSKTSLARHDQFKKQISQLFEIMTSSYLQLKIFRIWESDISPYHQWEAFLKRLLLWKFSNIYKSRENRIINPHFHTLASSVHSFPLIWICAW